MLGDELIVAGHVVSQLRLLPLRDRGWALSAWRLQGSLHGSALRRLELGAVAGCLHAQWLQEAVLGLLEGLRGFERALRAVDLGI